MKSPSASVSLCRLLSSDSLTCVEQCTCNTYGDWCFAAAGLLLWNSLPAELRQCHSLKQFKWRLKTHFSIYGTTALCDCLVKQCRIEILLLTYPIFFWKKWPFLVIALLKVFLAVVSSPLPSSHVIYPMFFVKSAKKYNFIRISPRSAPSPP